MPKPLLAMICLWVAWALSWWAAALWASRAQARPPLMRELPYRLITAVGVVLLFHPRLRLIRLWSTPEPAAWALVAVAALGFGLCWWARLHLGRLWSASVTRKADHRIVDTGPYAVVRHPIYTGVILAAAAMAVIKGSAGALLGLALMVLAFWMKARLEERFLGAELGEAAYDDYRRRTGMLFPGL